MRPVTIKIYLSSYPRGRVVPRICVANDGPGILVRRTGLSVLYFPADPIPNPRRERHRVVRGHPDLPAGKKIIFPFW